MLKLNYTDSGPYLEPVTASLETIATQRVTLAFGLGEALYIEPGQAALLLPIELPGITQLEDMLKTDFTDTFTVTLADEEFVEVSFKGTWIASGSHAESGTFITALPSESEQLIYQLWQVAQPQTVYFR